jgi:adenylate kinase family enzyme
MRVAILGNSGSGKSTLAHWLGQRAAAAILDLDTVAWHPSWVAVARPSELARADVRTFCAAHDDWVVEGCYASLVAVALEFDPVLVLLDPGEAQCIANCRARPFEPHKYASRQEQDERLEFLLAWAREYYTRDGDLSLAAHRASFEGSCGRKVDLVRQPSFDPPDPKLTMCLG